jgi:hypothetical protein
MMLSSSAVDRVSGIQTGHHGETHRLIAVLKYGTDAHVDRFPANL